MNANTLRPEFVTTVPDLQDGVLYVSMPYATAIHLCACGCGNQVVTPLSPSGWQLTFDGESVTLRPSIGNWRLPCRSHYWIRQNEIHWADTPPRPNADAATHSFVARLLSRPRAWLTKLRS